MRQRRRRPRRGPVRRGPLLGPPERGDGRRHDGEARGHPHHHGLDERFEKHRHHHGLEGHRRHRVQGGSAGGNGSGTRNPACVAATTRTTATVVSRPLNHLLLTVTNKSSKNCDLTGYPIVRFSEAQSVPPVAEETHPQAVVTLAPGESGYAGVLLSAADGSGVHGYTAKTLEVYYGDQGRNGSARPALPAKGVYIDEKLTVTYWQQDLDTALSY